MFSPHTFEMDASDQPLVILLPVFNDWLAAQSISVSSDIVGVRLILMASSLAVLLLLGLTTLVVLRLFA